MVRIKKIFCAHKYISKGAKKGFEGWYYKCKIKDKVFAFIIGVCNEKNDKHSFIQYIDSLRSHYFRFDHNKFSFNKKSNEISIENNRFSYNGISVDLAEGSIELKCSLQFSNQIYFKGSITAPTSMGWYSYLPIPAGHLILMLNSHCSGSLSVNGFSISGTGDAYIEKDFGTSFPKEYLWFAATGTHKTKTGQTLPFFLTVAQAESAVFNKAGHICILYFNNLQYNFSSYKGARLSVNTPNTDFARQTISMQLSSKKGSIEITLSFNKISSQRLIAPNTHGMKTQIRQNLSALATISLNLLGESELLTLPAAVEQVTAVS